MTPPWISLTKNLVEIDHQIFWIIQLCPLHQPLEHKTIHLVLPRRWWDGRTEAQPECLLPIFLHRHLGSSQRAFCEIHMGVGRRNLRALFDRPKAKRGPDEARPQEENQHNVVEQKISSSLFIHPRYLFVLIWPSSPQFGSYFKSEEFFSGSGFHPPFERMRVLWSAVCHTLNFARVHPLAENALAARSSRFSSREVVVGIKMTLCTIADSFPTGWPSGVCDTELCSFWAVARPAFVEIWFSVRTIACGVS